MNSSDLNRLQSGDLVEYQQPSSHRIVLGTFQGWHAASGRPARLLVHTKQLGVDLLIDPQQVIRIIPRPGRRPPEVQGAEPRRLNRQTVWLSLAALLVIGGMAAASLLLVQGPPPATQRLVEETPVGHIPGAQGSPTPAPGSSTPPIGNVPTPPTPGTTAPPETPPPPDPTTRPTNPPGSSPTANEPAPRLSVNPTSLTFFLQLGTCALSRPSQALTIQNVGGGSLSWHATIQNPAYVSINTSSGTLGSSRTSQIQVTPTCGITIGASDTITLTSNGGTVLVTITVVLS